MTDLQTLKNSLAQLLNDQLSNTGLDPIEVLGLKARIYFHIQKEGSVRELMDSVLCEFEEDIRLHPLISLLSNE